MNIFEFLLSAWDWVIAHPIPFLVIALGITIVVILSMAALRWANKGPRGCLVLLIAFVLFWVFYALLLLAIVFAAYAGPAVAGTAVRSFGNAANKAEQIVGTPLPGGNNGGGGDNTQAPANGRYVINHPSGNSNLHSPDLSSPVNAHIPNGTEVIVDNHQLGSYCESGTCWYVHVLAGNGFSAGWIHASTLGDFLGPAN